MNSDLSVVLQYRLSNEKDWVVLSMAPAQYFDLEPDEVPDLDSVPQHNHACDYLDIPLKSLAATRIVLATKEPMLQRIIIETFWSGGRCRLIERVDEGSDLYRELIICSEIQADLKRLEVVRMVDQKEQMSITSHVIIDTQVDGTQREVQLFPDPKT